MKLNSLTLISSKGEGNFGTVWKARAEGIVQDAPHLNIVAVKTVKGMAIQYLSKTMSLSLMLH